MLSRALRRRPSGIIAVAVALVLLIAGCGGSATTPTPTPKPTFTPTRSASVTPTGTPGASPSATLPIPTPRGDVPGYPADKRLGNLVIDGVVAAVLSGDAFTIKRSLVFSQVLCVASPQGVGAPPKCPDGTPEGSPVLVFITGSCERQLVRNFEVDDAVAGMARAGQRLYAAWPEQTPTGPATALLFAGPPLTSGGPLTATTLSVNQYGIGGVNFGCNLDPKSRIDAVKPPGFALPPPN